LNSFTHFPPFKATSVTAKSLSRFIQQVIKGKQFRSTNNYQNESQTEGKSANHTQQIENSSYHNSRFIDACQQMLTIAQGFSVFQLEDYDGP
jgi:hypothetical protein